MSMDFAVIGYSTNPSKVRSVSSNIPVNMNYNNPSRFTPTAPPRITHLAGSEIGRMSWLLLRLMAQSLGIIGGLISVWVYILSLASRSEESPLMSQVLTLGIASKKRLLRIKLIVITWLDWVLCGRRFVLLCINTVRTMLLNPSLCPCPSLPGTQDT